MFENESNLYKEGSNKRWFLNNQTPGLQVKQHMHVYVHPIWPNNILLMRKLEIQDKDDCKHKGSNQRSKDPFVLRHPSRH